MVVMLVADALAVAGINATIVSISAAVAGVYLASLVAAELQLRQEVFQEFERLTTERPHRGEVFEFFPPERFLGYSGNNKVQRDDAIGSLVDAVYSPLDGSRLDSEMKRLLYVLESGYPYRVGQLTRITDILQWRTAVFDCYRIESLLGSREYFVRRYEAEEEERLREEYTDEPALFAALGLQDLADLTAPMVESRVKEFMAHPSFLEPLDYFLDIFRHTWDVASAVNDRLLRLRNYEYRLPPKRTILIVGMLVSVLFGCGVIAPMVETRTPSAVAIWIPSALYALTALYFVMQVYRRYPNVGR
jgi:hypothetical protein